MSGSSLAKHFTGPTKRLWEKDKRGSFSCSRNYQRARGQKIRLCFIFRDVFLQVLAPLMLSSNCSICTAPLFPPSGLRASPKCGFCMQLIDEGRALRGAIRSKKDFLPLLCREFLHVTQDQNLDLGQVLCGCWATTKHTPLSCRAGVLLLLLLPHLAMMHGWCQGCWRA